MEGYYPSNKGIVGDDGNKFGIENVNNKQFGAMIFASKFVVNTMRGTHYIIISMLSIMQILLV